PSPRAPYSGDAAGFVVLPPFWYENPMVYAALLLVSLLRRAPAQMPDSCQSLTINPMARQATPRDLMSGRSHTKFPRIKCSGGLLLPRSSSACAWSERNVNDPSGLCCRRAPDCCWSYRLMVSLNPNDTPLWNRRFNDA